MRVDGRAIVALPPCKVFMFKCEFGEEERRVYDEVEGESRRMVAEYVEEGTMVRLSVSSFRRRGY